MVEDSNALAVRGRPPAEIPKVEALDIPSIAKSLKEVYRVGSIPLVLIFIAAVVIFGLLIKGVLQALPSLFYLIGALVILGVALFLLMNLLAYRQWRDEINTRLENRRMEMDLYVKLSTAASELQDKFLISLLNHVNELLRVPGSTPEGRREEIKSLAGSLGTLVREFLGARNQFQLPSFTPVLPSKEKAVSAAQTGQPA